MDSLQNLFDMSGKVAVVTGGYKGLGFDIASAFLEYHAFVVITSRSIERSRLVADRMGKNVFPMELDQSDFKSCQSLADSVIKRFGTVDVLVNNAGGGSGVGECDFLKRDPFLIKQLINDNLVGPLFCSQSFGRYMVLQKHGTIINIGSISAVIGRSRDMYHKTKKMEQPVEYAAAKGGIVGFTRDLAAYMAPYNVRVNCISPGGFDKGELPIEFIEEYSERTPLGHMGVIGKEIKGASLFLASEASSYVTGQNLIVDGGFTSCK